MLTYFGLFLLSFSNEYLLTKYYLSASLGKRWTCVFLTLLQHFVSFLILWLNLIDVPPMSKEQMFRWSITAIAYGISTYIVVKPKNEDEDRVKIIKLADKG